MVLMQKITYVALGALLVVACQSFLGHTVDGAKAELREEVGKTIKVVEFIDYPTGKKAEYLKWIDSVIPAFESPDEVLRVASYDNYYSDNYYSDNYYSDNPHRLIESEFASMADAAKYFDRKEMRKIYDDFPNHATQKSTHFFVLRGEYTKR